MEVAFLGQLPGTVAGNVAQTVTRTVNVVDTIAPVIALNGDANITHKAGFVYVDANASFRRIWLTEADGCRWRSECKQTRHLHLNL